MSSATFPVQLTGNFTDDPATGASCDASPTNAVWFSYTPSTDGWRDVQLTNHTTTNAFSRLAVFESAACSPYGQELACRWQAGKTASTRVYMTSGTTYLILFHTDGYSYPMTDPEIDVDFVASGSGQTCAEAVDLTSVTMPLQLAGTFDVDPTAAGTCDPTPANAVWFTYTPSVTDFYRVTVDNHASGTINSRLAIFETAACGTYGAEQACATSTNDRAWATVQLTGGTTYLIVYHTDVNTEPTEAPEISIAPSEGDICANPADVSSVTFPYQIIGEFTDDPATGASCSTSTYNTVWYAYTPTATDWYQITLENFTTTTGYSRVAVFETLGCSPYGTPIACEAPSSKVATALVNLTAGQPYLIMFFTSSATYTMIDPEIDIQTSLPPPPGDDCSLPASVGSTNYYVGSSNEDCWSWSQNSSDDQNDHTFTCDSAVGGDVVVEYTTGASQTTLNFDATIANYQTSGYIGVEITPGPCLTGTTLYCHSNGSGPDPTDAGSVTVTPSTTYYVWVSDAYSGNYRPDIDLCLW
ncbi:MAG: hypothetical protein JRI23_17145 [Deltaproteobacteria bacterium]|nr:hypothetical protein [Deltaproteobacteria bacterium]